MVTLVNKLQQICTGLGEGAFSGQNILWNKLPMIVVVGGQARDWGPLWDCVVYANTSSCGVMLCVALMN